MNTPSARTTNQQLPRRVRRARRRDLESTTAIRHLPRVGAGFAIAALGSSLLVGGASAASSVAPDTGAPASIEVSDHYNVIAQGLVTFGDGVHHWSLGGREVTPAGAEFAVDGPTFLFSDGSSALVALSGVPTWRLNDNEAGFASGSAAIAAASGVTSTWLTDIGVRGGDGDLAFTPGASVRDLDLVRDVLASGEALQLDAEVSALVIVTSGEVVDESGEALAAGQPAVRAGELTLVNSGDQPAEVLVAIVGPSVDAAVVTPAAPPSSESAQPESNAPSTPPTPGATNPPAPTTTMAPDLSDNDNDQLTADEEKALGTDPNNNDTDGDGFWDGHEVKVTKTNPLKADTDGDGLDDYLEAHDLLTNALNPDTDGDGLTDGQEFNTYSTDPKNVDSDNDGYSDKAEVDAGTNPNNYNDYPQP